MRLSTSSSNYNVICCCDALLISDIRKANVLPTLIDLPRKSASDQSAKNDKQCKKSETDVQASKSGDRDQMEEEEVVVGCCISNCEQHLGAITSHKRLLVWRSADSVSWQLFHCWLLVKRPVDLVFDAQGRHVLVADKTGDVLNFSLDDAGKGLVSADESSSSSDGQDERSPAPVLLGHLSMLLSLTISVCGRYVASSDRDEKIRVSSYPRSYNIASFCLGHSEFVGQLRTLPSFPALLLSASGDGTLRLWNFEDGKELSVVDTHQHSHPMALNASPGSHDGQDSAASEHNNEETCGEGGDDRATNGRERVVPKQCAVVSVSVTTDAARKGTDIVAVVFDKSRTLALYGVSENHQLSFRSRAALPRPASTVCWLSPHTLATVCAAATSVAPVEPCLDAADDSSPVLVWQWNGEELTCVPQHPLSVFAAQHRHRFQGVYAMDPQLLYKQRYDNVADYQKKKQVRLLQQAEHQKQVQEERILQQSKRLRLAEPQQEMS
ncbi:tRNA (guanine-N(7)-)-methyltransferase non-catalytic subunit Trm82 [Trinorchestia longiramus]|nr:tRNA (guanine-N(7)-)-methyltransferase non-catalytic subunit Trm82 [Trinorchestia longiramus]